MVINGISLLKAAPIVGMATRQMQATKTSYGLSHAGYDIRIKQTIEFNVHKHGNVVFVDDVCDGPGSFTLASSMEQFQMPRNLVGEVKDKSTHARNGLSVFNTVIEPGWYGFLTLELVYSGQESYIIEAGEGIAQVIFTQLSDPANYGTGKYQYQENRPVEAR